MVVRLRGRAILIADDEFLIAADIAPEFERVGAIVSIAGSVRAAQEQIEQCKFAGAVLDAQLLDGDCSVVCAKLVASAVPFVMSSGYGEILCGPCSFGLQMPKPARVEEVVRALAGMLPHPEQA